MVGVALMLLIHGAYHFWPKRVAYRNDYCLSCEGPRRAIAIRTFDVGHIFWIPILPVGFWKHWSCAQCRRDPRVNPKTRRSFKWIGLFILILASVAFWSIPPDTELRDVLWIMRIAPTVGAILLLVHLLRTPKEPSLRQRLAAIPAADDTVCPFCGTPLVPSTGTRWSCPGCGVERW
jgi:hypothetical protein